jgi:hypothetical protein
MEAVTHRERARKQEGSGRRQPSAKASEEESDDEGPKFRGKRRKSKKGEKQPNFRGVA